MTIKLEGHITMRQVITWIKKGCLFEIRGFNGFIITDNVIMINIINEANKNG